MLDRRIEAVLRKSEALGSDECATRVEEPHRGEEPETYLADHVIGRHPRAVEEKLTRMCVGQRVLRLADSELIFRYDERRDPAGRALVRIGDGEDDSEVGACCVGDEVLVPVDHPVVAVLARTGANGLRVATGLR